MSFPTISIPFFLSGALLFALALFAWGQKPLAGSRAFSLFMLSISIYSLAYGFELASTNLETALFWNKIQYIGILTFPTLYLIFVLQYVGRGAWLNARTIALLFIPVVLMFIVKLFDESLHLIYASTEMVEINSLMLLSFTRGPIYIIVAIYEVGAVTWANMLLLQKRRFSSDLFRKQTGSMLWAAVGVYLVYGIYILDVPVFPFLEGIDINPLSFSFLAVGASLAIFRHRFLDLAPVARETLIETLENGVIVLDREGRVVDANPKALAIFGYPEPPLGARAERIVGPWVSGEVLESIESPIMHEMSVSRGQASSYYEVSISALQEERGPKLGYLMVVHDISEQKEIQKRLKELSLSDALTGLNNRRGFYVLAEQTLSMAKRMKLNAALFYSDIDGLKAINDNLGHAFGDQAIEDAADVFRASFRASDIVARLGGDEFVVLAIESKDTTVKSVLKRLESDIKKHGRSGRDFALSISTGVARYNWREPKSLEQLLDEADEAMYAVKREKKAKAGS